MNQYAFDLICSFEGCRLTAYKDGGGVLTIGFGHTGKDVISGLTITQEKANALLTKDLAMFEVGVATLVKVPLSDEKMGALIDFAYNLGLHALAGSTLLKLVNANKLDAASNEFIKWNHDNGKVIKGLTRRRQAEKDLFLSK